MNNNKKAIVVGATSGIGKEVAVLLANKGWLVGVAGRNETELENLVKMDKNIVAAQKLDITSHDSTEKLKLLIDKLGGVNLYFHSSGVGWQNAELETEKEIITVETNVVGFTRMVDFMWHYFETKSGSQAHIAVISSIAGTKGLGAAPSYSSSKRYINHYMECLEQLKRIKGLSNIHLTDIRPGFVKTPLLDDGGNYPMQLDAKIVAKLIVEGIEKKKRILTIDWKYRILVALWKHIPTFVWIRLRIKSK